MALPALEGDVVLRDETSPVFVQIANNSSKVNDSLIKVSANADKAAVAVKKMADAGKGGLGDLTKNNDDLKETGTILDDAAEKARRVAENMEALGDASISPQLATNIRKTRDEIDKLDSKVKEFRNAPKGDEKDTKSIADDLEKLGRIGALRQLPGIGQLADIGEVAADFPKLSAGAMAAAGAVGAIGLAAVGAYKGIEAIIGRANELNVANNIKDRLVPKFGDVDAAINEVEAKLQGRLSDQEALTFVAQIDVSGPLADIGKFGEVARTVQAYSDAFGQDWRKNLTDVTKAIQDGNGKFLEQSGVIQSADKAMLDYAASISKSVPQLDDLERKQALVSAVINDNKDVSSKAPSGVENFVAAQDKLTVATKKSKDALLDFLAALADPKAGSATDALTTKITTLSNALLSVEGFLVREAGGQRFLGSLDGDNAKKFDELRREKAHLEQDIFTEKNVKIPVLNIFGSDQDVAEAQRRVDDWQAQADRIQEVMDRAQADFAAKKPVTIPTVDDALKGATAPGTSAAAAQAASVPDATTKAQEIGDAALKQTISDQEEFFKRRADAVQRYIDEDLTARQQLGAANTALAESERKLQQVQGQSVQAGNLPQALASDQKALEEVQNKIQAIDLASKENDLAKTQKFLETNTSSAQGHIALLEQLVAGLADTSVTEARIKDSQASLAEAVKSGYADLTAIPASTDITGNIDSAMRVMQEAFSGGFKTVREKIEADIQKLTEEQQAGAAQAAAAKAALSQQGFTISGSTEDQAAFAQQLIEDGKKRLQQYSEQLAKVKEELATVNAEIAKQPAVGNVDVNSDLTAAKDSLIKQRDGLIAQIEREKKTIEGLPANPAGAVEAIQGEKAAAENAQKIADARVKLVNAEAQFGAAALVLKQALEEGNSGLAKQALAQEVVAKGNYEMAISQAKAAGASTELTATSKDLPGAFDSILASLSKLQGSGAGDLQTWAEGAIKVITETKAEIEGTTIRPPTTSGATQPGGSPDTGTQAATNATKDQVEAVTAAAGAYQVFLPMIEQTAAAKAADAAASATQTAAINASSASYAGYFSVVGGSTGVIDRLVASKEKDASASVVLASSTEQTIQVAGQLYSAVSGLPLAFDRAGLSSGQLASKLQSLDLSLQQIEFSAINAGASIASRLVPALGIAGSLNVGRQFAGQAAAIKDTFDAINQQRATLGEDPLGAQVLETSLGALQEHWNAQATGIMTDMQNVGQQAESMAQATSQAAEQMNSALDGIIGGVLTDSTKGLLPEDILPRPDAIDEPARRMADVAVKGFTSPWFEGLKNLFPPDVLAQGEAAIKGFAAQMVHDHQEGLTSSLYDIDAAAAKVIEKIKGQQNRNELIAQVREKVKGAAGASDLDIMEALGINVQPQRMQQAAKDVTLSFEQILGELKNIGTGESPIVALTSPKEDDIKKLSDAGTTAISVIGSAMETAATEGKYGDKAATALVAGIDAKKSALASKGKEIAKWMGDPLVEQFKADVPGALLEILVTKLIPLMTAAGKAESERTSGGETQ